jgi:hypothetical protein
MQARSKCSSRQPRRPKSDDWRPGFSLLAKTYPVSTIEERPGPPPHGKSVVSTSSGNFRPDFWAQPFARFAPSRR